MVREITPTVGYKTENFKHNKVNFTCYDMSGQGKYRGLWEDNYSTV